MLMRGDHYGMDMYETIAIDINRLSSTIIPSKLCLILQHPRLILGLRLANERRRYNATPSLIGWAHT